MAKITFPVEASHIMMFARAVGDTNPVYHDAAAAKDTEAGGIIAPPSFAQAVAQFDPDYHLRPKPGQKWFGSAKDAERNGGQAVVLRRPACGTALRISPPPASRRRADGGDQTGARAGKRRASGPAS